MVAPLLRFSLWWSGLVISTPPALHRHHVARYGRPQSLKRGGKNTRMARHGMWFGGVAWSRVYTRGPGVGCLPLVSSRVEIFGPVSATSHWLGGKRCGVGRDRGSVGVLAPRPNSAAPHPATPRHALPRPAPGYDDTPQSSGVKISDHAKHSRRGPISETCKEGDVSLFSGSHSFSLGPDQDSLKTHSPQQAVRAGLLHWSGSGVGIASHSSGRCSAVASMS